MDKQQASTSGWAVTRSGGAQARPAPLRRFWQQLDLAGQFLAVGAIVLLAGMLIIGLWVTRQIEDGVIRNSAATTALFVDSVVSPLFVNLSEDGVLSAGAARALDETLAQGSLGSRLEAFKIWRRDGIVSYASEPALIGQQFPVGEKLAEAWSGNVAAEYDQLGDAENASERGVGTPLLEIYSPIREPWSGNVIAVAEFYEHAGELETSLVAARTQTWLIVVLVTTAMLAALYGIVRRGSHVIDQQRAALEARVGELSILLQQNRDLRQSLLAATDRSVAINEQVLRRVSADLHDGPAQLLALATMRLGSAGAGNPELAQLRTFLDDAMREIRNISRGLALPEIETMTLADLLRSAVATHEERTGNSVTLAVPDGNPPLETAARICIYRFVQESLGNANRHAGGRGLVVEAQSDAAGLTVTVRDAGPGFDPQARSNGLGLQGLRERIESLGGRFAIASSAAGSVLTCFLPRNHTGALA